MIKKAHALVEDLIHRRRDFHTHPELGFTETRTAKIVADELEKLGYKVRRGVGKTGVTADFGPENGKTIAVRADMDALPILESTDREYASENKGIMHACGHDTHTAMALGVAAILAKEKLPGRVRFLFQPSEEMTDSDGLSGAQRMVEDGAIEGVDFVVAQHVDPQIPVGKIGISSGPVSGGIDNWFGKIFGIGGHGANPHQAIDPFFILGHVIIALNGIVSRRINPFNAAVVSIGIIKGGFAENVIPEKVELSGTLRYNTNSTLPLIRDEIRRAFEISKGFGGNYELHFESGGGPNHNHEAATRLIQTAGGSILGPENILPIIPTLGAEDFGIFSTNIPGAMYTLGTRIEGDERTLHHPRFDIDERALPIGTAVMAEAVMQYLNNSEVYHA